MKAFYIEKYGDPEAVLNMIETDQPQPKKGEVLIKVAATTVNDYDWCLASGTPLSYRLFFGIFSPRRKHRRPGMETAGTVIGTGPGAAAFKAGDRVYGDTSDHTFGAYAEFQCVSQDALRMVPEWLSFEKAVCMPHAACLAWQGLVEIGKQKPGQEVLINGGGGGVGVLATQIAVSMGAKVTGVDSSAKAHMMLGLGCAEVIDYRKQDFTKSGKTYDLILDCRTNRYPASILKALKPQGVYVSIGGSTPKLLLMFALKPFYRLFTKKNFRMVTLKANQNLAQIEQLISEGKLTPHIDGPYAFSDLPKAVKRFGEARHLGKVVVKVG